MLTYLFLSLLCFQMDILSLQAFYKSPLGVWVHHCLCLKLKEIWPQTKGEKILGLGYCFPYLATLQEGGGRVVALAPAQQGVLRWPPEGPSLTVLSQTGALPFLDEQIDRVVVIHSLESCEQTHKLLREIWRILACQGRLLLVVPNRSSIWSHLERTPFGQGHPYTLKQISQVLQENSFLCTQKTGALYMPPTQSRLLLSSASTWETVGKRWCSLRLSGVLIIEATKQVYAGMPLAPLKRPEQRPILLPL